MEAKMDGMLSPYRVLDLTDEKGFLCGKLLGDLGADVIKIERPGGDPARSIGPFYNDEVDPEKSLFWFAFNTSKRGITLDIESTDGQEVFKRLVKKADFVIESFPPGYMDRLGLGYPALEKLNPGIIMVSITPFGQAGPYKDYKAPDIVAWAMGGVTHQYGDADRPPVWISYHFQAYAQSAVVAAGAALVALYYRGMTGEGQHVDVSIRESVIPGAYLEISGWEMTKAVMRRAELVGGFATGGIRLLHVWPCQDGFIIWRYSFGAAGGRRSLPLTEWMEEEGMADDFIKGFDWDTFDLRKANQETIDHLTEATIKFFMSHTKAELLDGAVKRRVMLYPVATTKDMLESIQLAARGFWVEVEHPELGTSISYPGSFANASEAPPRISRRAPLIGEHNEEVYGQELAISKEELLILGQAGVI